MALRFSRRRRNPEGRMPLADHLRELRNRLVVSIVAILLASIVGWWKYEEIFTRLTTPFTEVAQEKGLATASVNFQTITDSFSILVTTGLFVGFLLASPIWIYQIWAFVVPGLTRREKRIALIFGGASGPLFVAGCALGLLTLPRAVHALLSFTPPTGSNIMPAADYLSFVLKFMLAFGFGFLLPVFLVALNAARLLPARVMLKGWRVAVFLIFLFAAMMTPTPDAYTMILMALPLVALFFLAVGISALLDRRRARRAARAPAGGWGDLPDDQPSPL